MAGEATGRRPMAGNIDDEWRTPVEGWEYKGVPPYKAAIGHIPKRTCVHTRDKDAFATPGPACRTTSGTSTRCQVWSCRTFGPTSNQCSQAPSALGYPTQKPVALLRRIIETNSNPGDVVLDPFCGCGTTVAAAELTQRRWVGIDISPFAVKLVRDRRLRPMGLDAEIAGIPTDMEGAEMLLARSPLDFEAWAVTSVPGLAPMSAR